MLTPKKYPHSFKKCSPSCEQVFFVAPLMLYGVAKLEHGWSLRGLYKLQTFSFPEPHKTGPRTTSWSVARQLRHHHVCVCGLTCSPYPRICNIYTTHYILHMHTSSAVQQVSHLENARSHSMRISINLVEVFCTSRLGPNTRASIHTPETAQRRHPTHTHTNALHTHRVLGGCITAAICGLCICVTTRTSTFVGQVFNKCATAWMRMRVPYIFRPRSREHDGAFIMCLGVVKIFNSPPLPPKTTQHALGRRDGFGGFDVIWSFSSRRSFVDGWVLVGWVCVCVRV